MASSSSAVLHDTSSTELHSRPASHDHGAAEVVADPKTAQSSTVEVQRDPGDYLDHGLRRGLKGRHFVLIALGSIIGPGLFLNPPYCCEPC